MPRVAVPEQDDVGVDRRDDRERRESGLAVLVEAMNTEAALAAHVVEVHERVGGEEHSAFGQDDATVAGGVSGSAHDERPAR